MTTLASRVGEKRWREVFLLSVRLLKSADSLLQLMKQQIDSLLATDEKLQQYLAWVEEKSNSVRAPYKLAAMRAYYLLIDQNLTRYLDFDLALAENLDSTFAQDLVLAQDPDFSQDFAQDLAQDLALAQDLEFVQELGELDNLELDNLDLNEIVRDQNFEEELKHKLQQLKTELPNPGKDSDIFKQWWVPNGTNWIEKLRAIMIEHRNIGHDWQFTDSQEELLEKYCGANKLLVECLNSDCYVSRDVRKYIEDTLILPIKSIPPARL